MLQLRGPIARQFGQSFRSTMSDTTGHIGRSMHQGGYWVTVAGPGMTCQGGGASYPGESGWGLQV